MGMGACVHLPLTALGAPSGSHLCRPCSCYHNLLEFICLSVLLSLEDPVSLKLSHPLLTCGPFASQIELLGLQAYTTRPSLTIIFIPTYVFCLRSHLGNSVLRIHTQICLISKPDSCFPNQDICKNMEKKHMPRYIFKTFENKEK